MSRYIDADKLSEMIEARAETLVEGKEAFYYIANWLNKLPPADVTEVVHCKDCKYFQDRYVKLPDGSKRPYKKGESIVPLSVGINVGSYCTRIDYAIVHGYRNGEPSVDETRLWTKPDDFCSYGERKNKE